MNIIIDEEIMKEFLSPRKEAPNLGSKNELKSFLIALINFCEKSKNLNDENEAISYLRSKMFIDNILKTTKGLQTHNTKIPDANRPLPGPLYRNAKFKDEHYVYSSTTNLKRKLFWALDAAYLGKKHFLTAQFIYQGKLTSISEEFYFTENEKLSDVILILEDLGLSSENKEIIKTAIFKSLSNNPTYIVDPQILWPSENGEYTCITPVVSCGMQREIWERKESFKEGMFREYEIIGVAGSKAGNAGDLSSSIMGKFRLLKSGIPIRKLKENETIWKTVFKNRTGFNIYVFGDVMFSEYLKHIDEGNFHFTYKNKQKLSEYLEDLLEESLRPVLEVHYIVNYKRQEIPDWVKNKMNPNEVLFYSNSNKINIDNFAITCLESLKKSAIHKEDFMSPRVSEFVLDLFSKYLKGILL